MAIAKIVISSKRLKNFHFFYLQEVAVHVLYTTPDVARIILLRNIVIMP